MTDEARTVVAALHRLSDDVAEPPTVLTDAYRRAGQLRRRHRAVLAAVLVLALTAVGAGAQWYANTRPGPNRTAAVTGADLLTQPTRGDLAADAGLRARVLTIWGGSPRNVPRLGPASTGYDSSLALYQLSGGPTVLLAQQTPAGPVAIVAQRAVPANRTPAPTISGQKVNLLGEDDPIVSIGFLATGTGGQLTVVDATIARVDRPVPGLAFLAGADRTWLVVLSTGGPLGLSTRRDYHPDGRITRPFQEIPLNDRVGVQAVPAVTDDEEALSVAALPATDSADSVMIYNEPPPTQAAGTVVTRTGDGKNMLPWGEDTLWTLPDDRGAAAAWGVSQARQTASGWTSPAGRIAEAWENAFMDAMFATPTGAGTDHHSGWYVFGALPDGRGFIVGEGEVGDDPSYLYGAMWDHGKTTNLYGGKIDPTSPLPVRYRFPDGQGWVVAAKGATLAYRTDAWHDAGRDAALVPAGATQVRVTPAGGQPTVVPLG